jgi:hypothetical protein
MLNCLGALLSVVCVYGQPDARIIHVPQALIGQASPEDRERWLRDCAPRLERGRWRYRVPGCEYGP